MAGKGTSVSIGSSEAGMTIELVSDREDFVDQTLELVIGFAVLDVEIGDSQDAQEAIHHTAGVRATAPDDEAFRKVAIAEPIEGQRRGDASVPQENRDGLGAQPTPRIADLGSGQPVPGERAGGQRVPADCEAE